MKRILAALIVTASLASQAFSAPPDEIHWTIIGPTSITFDWRGTDSQIQFGTSPGAYAYVVPATTPSPVPIGTGPFWEARLTGLHVNQLYYYRIGTQPEHHFRTPPPRGSAGFWFAEEADVGASLSYPQVALTQDSIAVDEPNVPGADSPAFTLVNGDLTYGDQDGITRIDQHFNDVMVWSQDAAYMPTWGNHEWEPKGSVNLDQINDYKGRFDLPNPQLSPGTDTSCVQNELVPGKDWYWFDYGNVRFICYPPGAEGSCGYAGARQAWTVSADSLMAEVDHDPQIRFVVSYGHFPSYSSGADHGSDPQRIADQTALRVAHPKYVLNIAAHSHHYERFDPAQTGGLLQVIGAGGGATLGALAAALPATVVRFGHLEHLKLHVSDNRIDGFTVCGPSRPEETSTCVAGTVIDSWSIVSVDSIAPSVELTSPVGGENWPAGAARNITWSAIDNIGVSTVDILLSRGGNAGPFDLIALGQPNTGSYLWRVSGPSTANAVVKVVANDPTGNSGSDLSDAVFAISALTRVTGPPTAELALFPVSPNPVRAASRFEFALPQDARVRLGLFDLLGRERAVLASGTFTAGAHSVDWDRARDGELVPGLYFLRMSAMGHTLAQRFVLMR